MDENFEMNDQVGSETDDSVKLSRRSTVVIMFCLLIMAFILVITVRSCSIEKSIKNNRVVQTSEVVVTEPSKTATNVPRETTNFVENEPEFEVTVTSPVENLTSENNTSSTVKESASGSDVDFSEVADPVMSTLRTDYGMVIGKSIYKKGNSYFYGVNISIVINESSVLAEYFCPRKTYEELSSGDSLEVQYQVDSTGNISIYSISRG